MTADQIAHMEKRLDRDQQDIADTLWMQDFLARADVEADGYEVTC